jgi:hypothetical protein
MNMLTADEIETDFLREELDTACSLLREAQSHVPVNPTHCFSAFAAASETLATVRRLGGHIEDVHAWRDIHTRASELKRALAEFSDWPIRSIAQSNPLLSGKALSEKAQTR